MANFEGKERRMPKIDKCHAMAAIILEQEIHNEAEHELTITKIIEKIQEIKPKVMKETYYVSEVH